MNIKVMDRFWSLGLKATMLWGLLMLGVLISPVRAEVNFFIDSSAATSGDGSLASPWKSFSNIDWAVIGVDVSAGQNVNINLKRGSVWNEQFQWGASGTASNPITLQAYGTGAPPEINGSVPISSGATWAQLGSSNIYSTTLPYSTLNFTTFNNGIWGNMTASAAAIAHKYDWYYDSSSKNYYVYCPASQNPATYYNNIAPLAVGVNQGNIDTNNNSYLKIKDLKIDYFSSTGIRISSGSDHVQIAYNLIDGNTCLLGYNAGIFEQNRNANDISIFNTNIVRSHYGIITSQNANVNIKNSAVYANTYMGLESGGTGTSYDYSQFFGNYSHLTRIETNVRGSVTAGSHNLDYSIDPAIVNKAAFKPYISLAIDDTTFYYQNRVDKIVQLAKNSGVPLTLGVVTATLPSSNYLDSWIKAGVELAGHGYSHQYYNQPNVINIAYTGTGTACSLSINNNTLTTTVTGGPGGQNLNIDLTNPSYDQISKLIAYINSIPGYTASMEAKAQGTCHSYTLDAQTNLNIKDALQTLAVNPAKLMTDEASQAKQILDNILAPYDKTATDYIFPGNFENAAYQEIVKALGFLGARGTPASSNESFTTTGIDVYGMLTTNINNFHGMSQTEIAGRIASAAMKSALWGQPLLIYFHPFSGLTDTEIGWILDDMKLYGIPCDMATLVDYIKSGENIDGDYYVKAPDSLVSFALTESSPLIDKGDDLGLAQDILGNPVPFSIAPDIGAYEYVPLPSTFFLLGSGLLGLMFSLKRRECRGLE